MVQFSTVNEENQLSVDTIMLFNLDQTFYSFEEKILSLISQKKFNEVENELMDFCIHVIQLPEKSQLFVLRIFFFSIIMNLIRKQSAKEKVPTKVLENSYHIMFQIEKWKTNSEFMLHISWFVKQIKSGVIIDHLIYRGNKIVEKTLTLIYHHLKSDYLSVQWLAQQLNVSPTYVTSLFNKHLNINASTYIAEKKIEAIMYALKHSNDSLHTIRKQYGFHNHSHFIQFFKKYTGLTPLQYLQQHVV